MACAGGVLMMVEARVGFGGGDGVREDLLRLSTPILRRLVERGREDAAWRFEPMAGERGRVKRAPARWEGEGWGWGAGKEKVKM